MAYIDELKKQINKAQAESMRKNDSISSKTDKTNTDAVEIFKNIRAEEEAKKQSAQDSRTTAQKLADAQSAYDAYMGSTGQQQKQQEVSRNALREAMDRIFAPPTDTKAAGLKATVDYYQNQQRAENDQTIMDADLAEYEKWSDEDKANLARYMEERDQNFFNSLNPAMSGAYNTNVEKNPLIEKIGVVRANEIAESLNRQKSKQRTEKVTQAAQESAGKNFLTGTGHTLLSVPASTLGGIAGIVGLGKEGQQRTGRYSTLDPNNEGYIPSVYAGTVRGEVAGNIAGDEYTESGAQIKEVGKGRELLSYGYQGIMSLADSISRSLIYGPAGGAALAATSAFTQSVADSSRKGATPQQAAMMGVADAGIEYITEKIPIDEVFKIAKGGNANVLRQAFKQAGVEITTEELSLFVSLAAEAAILQEKSEYNQLIGELCANGASYEEAREQANKKIWGEAKQTAIVSGIAGGLSGGGAAAGAQVVELTREQREQQAIEKLGAELAKQVVEPEKVQPTEGEKLLQKATDALLGVKSAEAQNNTAPGETIAAQDHAESTSVNTDPAEHTPQEQTVIDAYQDSVDNDLVDYVQLVKENPGKKLPRYPLNPVADRAAADIQRLTGIDVRGNKTEIESRMVEHILKDHGENGSTDRSMKDVNDIGRIQYVIDNYDSIEHGGTSSAYVYQNQHGRNANAQTVVIKKKVNGTYFVVEAVPDTKKKTLFVVSAYMNKNGQKETAPSLSGNAEASRFTSNNATKSDAVSNDSITESGTQVKGTGAAEQNFSGKAQYQDLLYEGNVQPDRPGDVRPIEVPKTDSYGRNVSETVANLYGAEITPDSMASQIENLVQEGALGFDRRNNQDALNDAAKDIEKKGAYSVRNQITMNVANGKIKDGDIEKAMLLYANYANKKGQQAMDNASELMVDLATMAHMTGRNLQLFKLLRKMTPEGQAMTIRKTVERNVESMIRSGQVKKGYSTEIDPALLKEYQEAAAENARAVSDEQKEVSAERMQQIQQAIFADVAAKMPATFKAKWDAWRYMAMLGNAKTQVRNIVGNALFVPYKAAKDKMAAVFEMALPQEQRTKSVGTDFDLIAWAKGDAKSEDVSNALKYSAKLGDDVSSAQFAENRKVFDTKALEAIRKFVEKVPQAGDMIFKNDYYARSLAGFLKARGYDYDTVSNGGVSDAVMTEARGYAIQEAMKATFNDSNAFSDAFSGIGRKQTDNPWSKALNVAAEGILPFRRTPANIVVRFAEYSPVGLAKGVWDMATKVRSGDLSAAAAIDQISAGLTGSAVMALGYFLAKGMMGVKLTGSGTDDDEKRQGHQDYALEFSIDGQEYSYKIDWAAPANLPLFMGANLYKAIENAGGDTDVSTFTSILHSLGTMFEPMLALSCMSSLNDLVEGIRYAPEGEALYSIASDVATSYFTQGVPALVRQTHQAIRENKQTTFANSEDATMRDLQKLGADLTGGGANQTDKLNAWGETETTESGWERAFNAYFNPGTYKKISNDPVEMELNRLKGTQVESVSPPKTAKTVSYTDSTGTKHENQRLTEEQYQTLAKTQGQTAKKLLDQIVNSEDYKALTDMQKAAAVNAVYEYAAEAGKKAALPDYYSQADAWIGRVDADPVNGIIQRGAEKVLESVVTNAVKSLAKGWTVTDAAKKDMDESYAAFDSMTEDAKTALLDQITGDALKYLEVRSGGVSTEQYLQAAEDVKQLKPEEGYSDIRDVQTREAIADSGLDAEVIDTIMKAYMKDYDPESDKPDKTELRYDYARKELGLSPAEYAEVYRVQADGGEKDEKIKAWMALGYSQQEAMILYNLFASTSKQAIDVVKWHNEQ